MSDDTNKPVTVPWVAEAPGRGERLVMMTAYDYPQARLVDRAGIDIALVGDSLAMVVLGHKDTLSVTVDEMLHHVKAVRRGLERALMVADMPYGSFHLGARETISDALRFVKEGGAQAVKIEGHRPVSPPNRFTTLAAFGSRAAVARRGPDYSRRPVSSKRPEPLRWCWSVCPGSWRARSAKSSPSPRSASARDPSATGKCW